MISTLIKIKSFLGGLNKYLGLSKGLNVVSVYDGGLETNPGTLLCNRFFALATPQHRRGSSGFFGAGLLNQKKGVSIRCLHSRKAAYTTRVPLQKWENLNLHPSLSTILKDKTRGGLYTIFQSRMNWVYLCF